MKKHLIHAIIIFAVCIIVCTVMPAFAVNADAARTVRVGWYGSEKEDAVSNAYGYNTEYLQAISQYTGWKYEYFFGTWDECLKALENGKIDILGFVQKTPQREQVFDFPELPMAITSGLLVTGADSSIKNSDSDALNGITVGRLRGSAYNADFIKYCDANGINVNFVTYDDVSEISPALKRGSIDAAVVAEEDKTAFERIVVKFVSNSQYFVTNAANKELGAELNSAMIQLNTYCPYLNSELYQKYFSLGADGKPIFTSAEIEFIKNNPDILVKYDSGWPPIEYLDESSGEYKGISPDMFKLLSEKCGINFVYEGSTSGNVLSQLQNEDEKNVLTTISYDYGWAQKHNTTITQPFISSDIVKLGKNLNAQNPVVAVNEKAYFTYLLAKELKDVKTINYSKQAQRLEAVRTGKADYTFVTEDQANYYRSIPKYSNLKVEKMVDYQQKVCISISENSDPELLSVISKSLASISHDELTEILLKNTVNSYKLTPMDFLYKYRFILFLSLITLIALIALLNAKMHIDKTRRLTERLANNARSEFLSHVSHDIRTPLNAIIGITSLAIEEPDYKLKTDYLTKINESGKYLLGLINDTLDMSKIENGKLRLHLEAVNFEDIYTVITAVIMPKANEKNLTVNVKRNDVHGIYVMIDKLRVEQIILNLLNNAVKFTPENGTVTCTVSVTDRTDGTISYKISVSDTGVGMSDEFMEKLFVPFEQERNRLSVENGGTGLGLSIVKSLVDLMGGKITCKSKKNVGTEFVVEFTSRIATQAEIDNETKVALPQNDDIFKNKHVLLAEDNSMNILVAQKMLEKKDIAVDVAQNGEETVDMFKRSKIGFYDTILMDIHMPKMDGLKATKLIRALNRDDAKHVPIVALSANAYDEDRKECIEAGMNDHVAKPIEPDLLFNALKRAFKDSI